MAWTPHPRRAWVDDLAAFGRGLGDDGRSMVSLEPRGPSGRGRPGHRTGRLRRRLVPPSHSSACARALDEEAQLHLPGRIRARAELQLMLQNRLRLVDLWRREPAIADRGGHRPDHRDRPGAVGHHAAARAAGLRSRQPGAAAVGVHRLRAAHRRAERADDHNPRATLSDQQVVVMNEMVPAFTTMHDNRGYLPTECIFAFAHQFSSDMFTGLYNVGSYTIWRSSVDQAPIYDWHRRMLQTWQWGSPTHRWVLKAPSHLSVARPGLRHLSRRPGGHHPPRSPAGGRIAGRHDGHAALDALRSRRPRDPGRCS